MHVYGVWNTIRTVSEVTVIEHGFYTHIHWNNHFIPFLFSFFLALARHLIAKSSGIPTPQRRNRYLFGRKLGPRTNWPMTWSHPNHPQRGLRIFSGGNAIWRPWEMPVGVWRRGSHCSRWALATYQDPKTGIARIISRYMVYEYSI